MTFQLRDNLKVDPRMRNLVDFEKQEARQSGLINSILQFLQFKYDMNGIEVNIKSVAMKQTEQRMIRISDKYLTRLHGKIFANENGIQDIMAFSRLHNTTTRDVH